jgi:hypothetical protein
MSRPTKRASDAAPQRLAAWVKRRPFGRNAFIIFAKEMIQNELKIVLETREGRGK